MSATTRTCPACGAAMHFRLGEFECDGCPHREKGPAVHSAASSGPAHQQIPQSHAQVLGVPVGTSVPQAQLETLRSTQDYRRRNIEPEKYDPAPGLEREKTILFAIYAGRVLLTLAIAFAGQGSFEDPNWLIKDGVGLALITLALFTPITPIKWIVAWLSGITGLLGLIGLFWHMLVMGLVGGHVAPGWYGFFGYVGGVIIGFAAAAIEIWLASALFRDIHRQSVLRGR